MANDPPKRFTFKKPAPQQRTEHPSSTQSPAPISAPIRDKDNAQPRIKPPRQAKTPPPRMGPPGTTGIRRNLPTPAKAKAPPKKPFTMGQKGNLQKTFKPIVNTPRAKGPDIDR